MLGRHRQSTLVALFEQLGLAMLPATPYGSDGVDYMSSYELKATRDAGFAGWAPYIGANQWNRFTSLQQPRPRRVVDRAVYASATQHELIGCVDDGIDIQRGDVALKNLDSHSETRTCMNRQMLKIRGQPSAQYNFEIINH